MTPKYIAYMILGSLVSLCFIKSENVRSSFFINREPNSHENQPELDQVVPCLLSCISECNCDSAVSGSDGSCSSVSQGIQQLSLRPSAEKWEKTSDVRKSCNDVWNNGDKKNGMYDIENAGLVYCHMVSIPGCGDGGWTLVIKMNGTKKTFKYDSPLWQNKQSYNDRSGQGMNALETKIKAYWTVNFSKLCVGMRRGSAFKWLLVSHSSSSLYELLASGTYQTTQIGRDRWKTLINGSSLQLNCNKEGFNVFLRRKVRIGIVSNQQNDCGSPDSFIGFGSNMDALNITCGNFARQRYDADNGGTFITTLGYVFVQ